MTEREKAEEDWELVKWELERRTLEREQQKTVVLEGQLDRETVGRAAATWPGGDADAPEG
eukprot:CAMPEP_0194732828 /NCGR_PEP_ID=MMETSP0296-20130528/63013_1 /TAXON_ID=39354 /ORGANISM="Heterosigma akashiwo, Strain CCMP2393" /LENGTH=59 /DNA_ID=CAMNT_0039640903 /DNA_START=504 /DNA_END=680 /DNA_ORIENTATION=-